MATQASFDITSNVDLQEVDNAVNQAKKELAQRYDFKGSNAEIVFDRAENTLMLSAEDKFKLDAVWEILQNMKRRTIESLKRSDNKSGTMFSRTLRAPLSS